MTRPIFLCYYINIRNKKNYNYCLTEYIRHQIHHPENEENDHYTRGDLVNSINRMREFITAKQSVEKEWMY